MSVVRFGATSLAPRSLRKPVSRDLLARAACARARPRVNRAKPRERTLTRFWASTACVSALCVSRQPVGAVGLLWCSLLFAVRA